MPQISLSLLVLPWAPDSKCPEKKTLHARKSHGRKVSAPTMPGGGEGASLSPSHLSGEYQGLRTSGVTPGRHQS